MLRIQNLKVSQAGSIRVIAVTNNQRFPGLPGVLTCDEQGLSLMPYEGLAGLFGTESQFAELRARIGEDVMRTAQDSSIKQRIEATGQMVAPGGAAVFQKSIAAQIEGIHRTAQFLGLKEAKVAP